MNLRYLGATALVIVAMLAVGAGSRPAEAQQTFLTPADIEAQIGPAVPRIETPFAIGSGILVGQRRVLTNAHVVEPFDAVTVTFDTGEVFTDVPVVAWDLLGDMVALELPATPSVDPLPIVSESSFGIGTAVYSLGYPLKSDGTAPLTVLNGRISGFRAWPALDITYIETDLVVAGGMSGGALVTSSGELIAFNEWLLDGDTSVGPSAADVMARLTETLAGGDVDRLAPRYPELKGPPTQSTIDEFTLLDGRDERVYVSQPDVFGAVHIVVDASEAAWVGAVLPDGTVIQASSEEVGATHVIEFYASGIGVPFYLIVDQYTDVEGRYNLHSGTSLWLVEDPDDRRVITQNQLIFGRTDYPFDRDVYLVPLTAGQTLGVEVQSLLVDEFAAVEVLKDGLIEVLEWDDDSGGGVWNLDPLLSFVAPEDGDYLLVIGGLADPGTGGFIANIQITDTSGNINGTFITPLPAAGLGLSSWGGGSIEQMVTTSALSGCQAESFWISVDGKMIGYVVGAPAFVNTPILALYPGGFPARTPLLVNCGV